MDLRNIKNRIDAASSKVPKPDGRPCILWDADHPTESDEARLKVATATGEVAIAVHWGHKPAEGNQ